MIKVELMEGKYTLIFEDKGGLRALRYGEEWQDLTGNGMVLALMQEIEHLKEQLAARDTHDAGVGRVISGLQNRRDSLTADLENLSLTLDALVLKVGK